ncbi:hypothetical protein ACOME3_005135 [Neoechinorhynchus agilis]
MQTQALNNWLKYLIAALAVIIIFISITIYSDPPKSFRTFDYKPIIGVAIASVLFSRNYYNANRSKSLMRVATELSLIFITLSVFPQITLLPVFIYTERRISIRSFSLAVSLSVSSFAALAAVVAIYLQIEAEIPYPRQRTIRQRITITRVRRYQAPPPPSQTEIEEGRRRDNFADFNDLPRRYRRIMMQLAE